MRLTRQTILKHRHSQREELSTLFSSRRRCALNWRKNESNKIFTKRKCLTLNEEFNSKVISVALNDGYIPISRQENDFLQCSLAFWITSRGLSPAIQFSVFYCSILKRATKFDSRFTLLYLKVSRDHETCSAKCFVANICTS